MAETTQPGHERSDFNPPAAVLFGAVLAATIAAVVAASFIFMRFAALREPSPQAGSPSAVRERAAVAPRLQVRGSNELREMREAEDRVLDSYAWIDREKGIVRIPVERAMDILAQKEKGKSKKAKGRGEIGATNN
jgi:hypothetical protein